MPFTSVYILHSPRRRLIKIGTTDGDVFDRQRAQELKYGGQWPLLYATQDEHPEQRKRSNSLESGMISHFPDRHRLRNSRGRPIEQFRAVEEVFAEIRAWRDGSPFKGLYPYRDALRPVWKERWLQWARVRAYVPKPEVIDDADPLARYVSR